MAKWHIHIVTPWFGKDLRGGAEQLAYQLATRLQTRDCQVTVLTTTCRRFTDDWSHQELPQGISEEDGILVRRFPVDPRSTEQFLRINDFLLQTPKSLWSPFHSPVSRHVEDLYLAHNINSRAMTLYLQRQKKEYDFAIFLPYLFGVTLQGVQAAAGKAILVPCLHDEVYAYTHLVRELFAKATYVLFNSPGESRLASRMFGSAINDYSMTVYSGVEVQARHAEQTSRRFEEPYFLYMGRRVVEKNLDFLIKMFYEAFPKDSPYRLVLIGPGHKSFQSDVGRIIDLGNVSEAEKANLIEHAHFVVNPSKYESFSRVLFEAWAYEVPVLVHEACDATRLFVEEAGVGGLIGSDVTFAERLHEAATMEAPARKKLGALGKAYGAKVSNWDHVISRYLEAFDKAASTKSYACQRHGLKFRVTPQEFQMPFVRSLEQLAPISVIDPVPIDVLEDQKILAHQTHTSGEIKVFWDGGFSPHKGNTFPVMMPLPQPTNPEHFLLPMGTPSKKPELPKEPLVIIYGPLPGWWQALAPYKVTVFSQGTPAPTEGSFRADALVLAPKTPMTSKEGKLAALVLGYTAIIHGTVTPDDLPMLRIFYAYEIPVLFTKEQVLIPLKAVQMFDETRVSSEMARIASCRQEILDLQLEALWGCQWGFHMRPWLNELGGKILAHIETDHAHT